MAIEFGSLVSRPVEDRLHGKVCDPNGGRARQEFRDDCDIRTVTERWLKLGRPTPPFDPRHYGDFTQVADFVSAFEAVRDAEESFAALPAVVRKRFSDDPGELIAFMEGLDEETRPEAIELGLVEDLRPNQPAPVQPSAGQSEPASVTEPEAT